MEYRKKPVEIEARQFNSRDDAVVILDWANGVISYHANTVDGIFAEWLEVKTLEGQMKAQKGDWIIRGVKGEFYPCKPDIFEATYEECAVKTQFAEMPLMAMTENGMVEITSQPWCWCAQCGGHEITLSPFEDRACRDCGATPKLGWLVFHKPQQINKTEK